MSIPFIDLKAQYEALKPAIQGRIDRVLSHGQYIMGPEVQELESRLAHFSGAEHCITVSSGTDALLISLMALNIGQGDEVITTPFTFAATLEVIVLVGATPVVVDIDPKTCNINPDLIEQKITERTKAILPVSLYGQPAEMDAINSVAAKYGDIPVIEDAAQSFGATYGGRKSCNLSTIGCTSFFPSKPLGCYGDGGAIFTNDDDLAGICREVRVHGQSERYRHTRVGVGGRLDTLQAAILLAKLDSFDAEIVKRRQIARSYDAALDALGVGRLSQIEGAESVYAQYTIFCDEQGREKVREKFAANGIPTAVHYPSSVISQPAYSEYCCEDCVPNSLLAAKSVLSLPISPFMSADDQEKVLSSMASIFC